MGLKRQQGMLGLMDIMIGLLVGSLVILSAVASLTLFRQYSRTGVSADQSLQNGISAIHTLQFNIKMAGLGFVANNLLACNTLNAIYNGNTIANGVFVPPALITPNNVDTTAPQTISVIYGNSIISGSPALMLTGTSSSSTSVNVTSALGMQANDYALLTTPGSSTACTLVQITSVQNVGNYATLNYSAGAVANSIYSANSLVVDIGSPSWYTWSIVNSNLQVQNNLTGNSYIIADNVVQLQAQYGITNGVSQSITSWVNPTGVWASLTPALATQVRAIRIAIVVRSPQREKSAVAGVCNTTTTAPVPWVGGNPVDLTANANWKCYRYQVYETVVPLKNVLLGGVA